MHSDVSHYTKKIKFSMKDFFSKYDQNHGKLRIWSHLLKKSLIENFVVCTVSLAGRNFPKMLFL